jgi:two-component system, OmpR family, heavy metal sensor histidine kinase CusS
LKNHSIGFRLAAWYFVVFAVALSIFGIAAWFAMQASIYHAVDDELRDRVRGVQQFMERQIASLSIPEIRDEFREHSVLGPGGDLFQVCDQAGAWLYRSVPLENSDVPIEKPDSLTSPQFKTTQVQGHALRFYSQAISITGKAYTVQVAAPMHEAFEALERFRILLLLGVPLFLIAASLGGYWMSSRALAPFDEISHAAERISIQSLTERLHVPQTGDQLQRLSQTLNQMFSRLEAAVKRMTQFTADASHELRAPVALIRTTAEVAVMRDRAASEYREALSDILGEAERMSQVIDSLMLLARTDSATESIEPIALDARAVVNEAAEQGEKLARSHKVAFEAEIPKTAVPIRAASDALRRALLILLDNAVKYTSNGGFVRLKLALLEGFAIMSVADTGIGIKEEDLPHIFDRFWRADKARSREHGGAGLGLSIAKWLIETQGGTISVTSDLGKGSTFFIRIPLDT